MRGMKQIPQILESVAYISLASLADALRSLRENHLTAKAAEKALSAQRVLQQILNQCKLCYLRSIKFSFLFLRFCTSE